jgi:ABC-type multidrug transport system fused ATPase/permease subunit
MKYPRKIVATRESFQGYFALLNRRDKLLVKSVVVIQILLGLFDLFGIALIGVLGSLSVRGVSSQGPGDRVSQVLSVLNLSGLTFQKQIAILALLSTGILISRTLLSIFVTKKILRFLSFKSAEISGELITKYLFQSLTKVRSRTIQQSLYSTTRGVEAITLGIIGSLVNLSSDLAILIILSCGLLLFDYKIAIATIAIFGFVSLVLFKILHKKAKRLGELENSLSIKSNERIVESLQAYRELTVSNRRGYYSILIRKSRSDLADVLGAIAFLPSISKYALEITVIVGTLLVSALQFLAKDASQAVATLAVFMAAASRIAPATMRLQQGLVLIKQSHASALPTLLLIHELSSIRVQDDDKTDSDFVHDGFKGEVSMKNVSLNYAGKEESALNNITFSIADASFIAIVGSSGAGKTSLVDVLLGVIEPSEGDVYISGEKPLKAISKWPGAISYVPQDVFISNDTILENVAFGFPISKISVSRVWDSLRAAQLEEIVQNFPDQLQTKLGEGGSRLSGGQRQRLGIARALYSNPKLIILDEATSSLDGKTEQEISKALSMLSGKVTIIVIAHRLVTVRQADKVVYLSNGKIEAIGSFDEVRSQVKDFDEQARLLGL